LRDFLADLPVAPGIDTAVEEAEESFEKDAKLLESPDPGHAGKYTPASGHDGEQEQRRAGVAKLGGQHAAKFDTEHAARRQRQHGLQRIKTQGFKR